MERNHEISRKSTKFFQNYQMRDPDCVSRVTPFEKSNLDDRRTRDIITTVAKSW